MEGGGRPALRPSGLIAIGVVATLAAGIIGGLVGGAIGSRSATGNASAGSSSGTRTPAVCNASNVSAAVLPSLVKISVTNGSSGGTGSGSVIDRSGHILTNDHVVNLGTNAASITVDFSRGKANVPATVVGSDPFTDVAVIKATGDNSSLSPIGIGKSADVVVGQPVVALGSPLGLTDTVTTGVVSALDRFVNVGTNTNPSVLMGAVQTDAAINPGNSGGPMVDCSGRQVGINSAGASPGNTGGGSVGLNFAIPMDFAMSEAKEIIATGKVTHPSIGIVGFSVTDEMAKATGRPRGVYIYGIVPGGPAAAAGLAIGDVVTDVGNHGVPTLDDYLVAVRQSKIGDTVRITYRRDSSSRTVDVRVVDGSRFNLAAA